MNKPATKFATKKNPFTDLSEITLTNDPITKKTVKSKYDHVLTAIKPGQSIRCPSGDIGAVSRMLRKHLTSIGKNANGLVKSVKLYTYPDGRIDSGFGRVWWVKKGGAA